MAFIQLMEFNTSKLDQIQELFDQWLESTKGKRTAQRMVLTQDRDSANTYIEIVEFPSYEEAMKNSNLPETQEIGGKLFALCDSEPKFRNLDVVRIEGS